MNCSDEEYYLSLACMDRLWHEIEIKKFNLCKLSKLLNMKPTQLYHNYNYCSCLYVNRINEICKVLDISLEYIMTGKNKQRYKSLSICFDELIYNYYKLPICSNKSKTLSVIVYNYKKGRTKNMAIKTYYMFSKLFKKDILTQITKEKNK